jgi:NAD dependent epimerase/dehydratase
VSDWSGRPVLVTGAGGFIGSHLTERLVREGARVRAFVHYNARDDWGMLDDIPSEALKEVEVVTGDLRDGETIANAVRGRSAVFHLAALIAIPYSYLSPRDVASVNVMGTLNVLEAVRRHEAEVMVHTSTSEVYGTAQTVPISEDHPLQGQSPYSASKIGADKIAESFWRAFGTPVAIVRPFNTYGPRQSARAVIPTIITQALSSDEIRLGSVHPTRDYTFVTDTVAGFLAIASTKEAQGRVLNIGTGTEISIGDLASKIAAIVGRDVPVVADETRVRPDASEVERLVADASAARAVTGWAPSVSLDDGLERTVAWMRDNLARYRVGRYTV